MRPFKPPHPEPVVIPGPAGALQALVQEPESSAQYPAAVVCHPHPQFEGTMHNKVVHTLARVLNQLGMPAVRFNFRGVGDSAGNFDHGKGETADALAVLDWVGQRWPDREQVLAGFSFGAGVALRAAAAISPARLITVAPTICRITLDGFVQPLFPWLVVIGSQDEFVNCDEVIDWLNTLGPGPELSVIDGAEHFFHGRLNELRDIIVDWMKSPAS